MLDLGPQRDAPVSELCRLLQDDGRSSGVSERIEDGAEFAEELDPPWIVPSEERHGTREEPRRGARIAALPGGDTGGAQVVAGVFGELLCVTVALRPLLGGLLEVEADELVVVEQVGEPFVRRARSALGAVVYAAS